MDKQQIFDTVRTHLLNQRAKSVDGNNKPLYRSAERMCAIGVLIPNGLYSPDMEHHTVYNLCKYTRWQGGYRFVLPDYFRPNAEFLQDLQRIHDDSPVEKWEEKLRALAVRQELTCPD